MLYRKGMEKKQRMSQLAKTDRERFDKNYKF
jgi:hypothetical protein